MLLVTPVGPGIRKRKSRPIGAFVTVTKSFFHSNSAGTRGCDGAVGGGLL